MKKTTFLISFLLMVTAALAHTITPGCNSQGRFKYICSDFADNPHQYVKIHISTGVWGNGTADTLLKIAPTYSFVVFVPNANPSIPVTVTFTNTNSTGSAIGEVHTVTTTNCTSLPLNFTSFKVTRVDSKTARVNFSIANVYTVKQINIQVSIDGKVYQTKAIAFPTQGNEEKQYAVDIKL